MTKQPQEIALMAESGKLLAGVFGYLDTMDLIGSLIAMQVNSGNGFEHSPVVAPAFAPDNFQRRIRKALLA